jgi:hypothetical protein
MSIFSRHWAPYTSADYSLSYICQLVLNDDGSHSRLKSAVQCEILLATFTKFGRSLQKYTLLYRGVIVHSVVDIPTAATLLFIRASTEFLLGCCMQESPFR